MAQEISVVSTGIAHPETHISASFQAHPDTDASPSQARFERQLGDTELSYFLPSRESGVNDM